VYHECLRLMVLTPLSSAVSATVCNILFQNYTDICSYAHMLQYSFALYHFNIYLIDISGV
jgi:hypothetical protein